MSGSRINFVRATGALALFALACAAALLVPSAASAGPTDWTQLRTLNITHQGGEDEAPSATMYAFERSMKLGSDMLEVDVNVTKDNKLAIIHDGSVDRTTNGTGPVGSHTLAEIKQLDAAHWFVPSDGTTSDAPEEDYVFRGVRTKKIEPPAGYQPSDFRPLELDELIQRYPDVPINIEIKGGVAETNETYNKVAETLAAYLNDLGRTEGIMVASFNDAAINRFHQLAPQIDLAPAVAGVAAYKFGNVPPPPGTKAFQVPIGFSGVTITDQDFVNKAHADGFGVHVWTINSEDEMRMLLGYGVDGIMTAEPMRLERVLCAEDVARPALPESTGGKHCAPKASIQCDVEAADLTVKGKKATVTLARKDAFGSKCAGKVTLKAKGTKGKRSARFDFGWVDTGEDTSGSAQPAKVDLGKRMAKKLKKAGKAKVTATPYDAFARKQKLPLG
jgi:glycerophosphoryl diester phosphodiesterase